MIAIMSRVPRPLIEDYRWGCLECGHTFRSAAVAERAYLSEQGCPGCGGTAFDVALQRADARIPIRQAGQGR